MEQNLIGERGLCLPPLFVPEPPEYLFSSLKMQDSSWLADSSSCCRHQSWLPWSTACSQEAYVLIRPFLTLSIGRDAYRRLPTATLFLFLSQCSLSAPLFLKDIYDLHGPDNYIWCSSSGGERGVDSLRMIIRIYVCSVFVDDISWRTVCYFMSCPVNVKNVSFSITSTHFLGVINNWL